MADNYTVYNKSSKTIWWRDGSWLSGDLEANKSKSVDSNHDATVTMFSKDDDGNHEWGMVIIPKADGICKVYGEWNWTIGTA